MIIIINYSEQRKVMYIIVDINKFCIKILRKYYTFIIYYINNNIMCINTGQETIGIFIVPVIQFTLELYSSLLRILFIVILVKTILHRVQS